MGNMEWTQPVVIFCARALRSASSAAALFWSAFSWSLASCSSTGRNWLMKWSTGLRYCAFLIGLVFVYPVMILSLFGWILYSNHLTYDPAPFARYLRGAIHGQATSSCDDLTMKESMEYEKCWTKDAK